MTRDQLAHVLRAAARIADDPNILVIGSQSILGSYWEDQLPEQAWRSVEADLAFFNDPDASKADKVDGAIGELSGFHQMYSYYAQGVEVHTAVLPDGWRQRVGRSQHHQLSPRLLYALTPTISSSQSSPQCAPRTRTSPWLSLRPDSSAFRRCGSGSSCSRPLSRSSRPQ